MKYVDYKVLGMSCGHCKAAVEGELDKLPGVAANADVDRGIVEVSYDEERVSEKQLEDAIEEAGYTVAS
jgi:copper chaperone